MEVTVESENEEAPSEARPPTRSATTTSATGVVGGVKADRRSGCLTFTYSTLSTLPYHLIDLHCQWVTKLDLSHNSIKEVDFVAHFERLEVLVMDHNLLCSATVFPRMEQLTTLWLNFNAIGTLHPFVDALGQSLPNLTYLSMMGNPAAPSFVNGGYFHDYVVYRYYILSRLKKLSYLDDREIEEDEKSRAISMYGQSHFFLDNLSEMLASKFLRNRHQDPQASSSPSGIEIAINVDRVQGRLSRAKDTMRTWTSSISTQFPSCTF